MKILIVCDHASLRYGGEAQLPLHHFRALRDLGVDVRLLAHARSRVEIEQLYPDDLSAIDFLEESGFDRCMWGIGRHLPHAVAYASTGLLARMSVQRRQRQVIRRLVAAEGIDLVHQPTPVSPCEPSMLSGLDVPVVIGPMNGGMNYPPAFAAGRGFVETQVRRAGRALAPLLNRIGRGKAEAALLIVANDRTFRALPIAPEVPIEVLCENGVDLDRWSPAIEPGPARSTPDGVTTFVFVGRLVRLKAVDLLLEACRNASAQIPLRLVIVGDGVERAALEAKAIDLFGPGAACASDASVRFTGHLSPTACAALMKEADALVFPSLNDCGGAVILEAMASGLPVIATAWGGALEYVAPSCGILVAPKDRDAVIDGFAEAMVKLAGSPELRRAMGTLARARARSLYGWPAKAQRMLGFYSSILARRDAERTRCLSGVRGCPPDPGAAMFSGL